MDAVEQKLHGLDIAGDGGTDACGVKEDIAKDEGKAGLVGHHCTEGDEVDDAFSQNDQAAEHNDVEQTAFEEKDDKDGSDNWSDIRSDYDPPPLELNYEALKHVARYFTPGNHGACVDITFLLGGAFHEIRVLHFEDGWSCIGRFTRATEPLHKTESELATMEYVRKHTTIKVPEVYYVNYNENHVVGAPFVLMERLDGNELVIGWEYRPFEHKLGLIEQMAGICGELASLKFDRIGSLKSDGSVGPLLDQLEWDPLGDRPFATTEEYLFSYIKEDNLERSEGSRAYYPAIKKEITSFLEQNASNATLHAPYRLIHGDFGMHNILVEQQDPTQLPKITGVIDWEWSHTGLLYYLFEYPKQLWDHIHETPEALAENKVLRKHFVSALTRYFPRGSVERELVRRCFREKNYPMSGFEDTFMLCLVHPEIQEGIVEEFLRTLKGDDPSLDNSPYLLPDWEHDSELESGDEE